MSAPNPFSPTALMDAELTRRGYRTETIGLAGKPYLRAVAPNGWTLLTSRRFFTYPFTSVIARSISVDKNRSYALAEQLGIAVPHTIEVPGASAEVLNAFLADYAPLVVKPVDGHGGHGVTLEITSEEALQAAIQIAQQSSERVLVQQQITGDEVRISVVNGKVVSVILRQTPRVVGDGRSTLAELIAKENEARALLHFEYLSYPQLDERLMPAELLTSTAIPAQGEVIELNKSTLIRGGASFYAITDEMHQTYKDAAVLLAANLGTAFLAVDMILSNHKQPLAAANYAFIETNTAPSLRIYYTVRNRKAYDIVTVLADMIDEFASRQQQ